VQKVGWHVEIEFEEDDTHTLVHQLLDRAADEIEREILRHVVDLARLGATGAIDR
jgi:hypothetical protein